MGQGRAVGSAGVRTQPGGRARTASQVAPKHRRQRYMPPARGLTPSKGVEPVRVGHGNAVPPAARDLRNVHFSQALDRRGDEPGWGGAGGEGASEGRWRRQGWFPEPEDMRWVGLAKDKQPRM